MSDDDLLTMKMSREAASRFEDALSRGSSQCDGAAERARPGDRRERYREDARWLRWGMGRLEVARNELAARGTEEEPDA